MSLSLKFGEVFDVETVSFIESVDIAIDVVLQLISSAFCVGVTVDAKANEEVFCLGLVLFVGSSKVDFDISSDRKYEFDK